MTDAPEAEPKPTRGPIVARILTGVMIFQLGLGALLVLGDIGSGGVGLPRFGPDAPRLSDPVRPGDQRRRFAPGRDGPTTRPARDPGQLPPRLVLTQDAGTTYRLEGGIEPGDADRIIAQFQDADPTPERLILQSPGGSVEEALMLGRFLRSADIATVMLTGEFCYSACPYMLAGGSTRQIARDAAVGVHQHYFGQSTILPAGFAVEDIQRGQGEVMAYLDEMGIDPRVMQHALTTPPDEIYILLPEELLRYGFTSEPD